MLGCRGKTARGSFCLPSPPSGSVLRLIAFTDSVVALSFHSTLAVSQEEPYRKNGGTRLTTVISIFILLRVLLFFFEVILLIATALFRMFRRVLLQVQIIHSGVDVSERLLEPCMPQD